ncbi:hypothetical protein [uncultured Planococcus sp.]|uniref:hypothetical protein n=1 Tax=uncultured Planococcus sp. TaxID=337815 RepID=UPI00260E62EB|nr:hypothetical protein [uncultured Planococcus sp.]
MDYKEVAAVADAIASWQEALMNAQLRQAQAEADIITAKLSLSSYEAKFTELLAKEDAK